MNFLRSGREDAADDGWRIDLGTALFCHSFASPMQGKGQSGRESPASVRNSHRSRSAVRAVGVACVLPCLAHLDFL